MRNAFLGAVLAAMTLAAYATPATPAKAASGVAVKPVAKTTKAFGLTESLAVLFACPDARFDNDQVIALGGVVRENKKRIDAAPVADRMDLMTRLVAEETAKANAYAGAHKMDCKRDAQLAATYWNKMIAGVAAEQDAAAPQVAPTAAGPATSRPVVPRNTEPVSGLQLP